MGYLIIDYNHKGASFRKRPGTIVNQVRRMLNKQGKIFKETHFRKDELKDYPEKEMVKFEW